MIKYSTYENRVRNLGLNIIIGCSGNVIAFDAYGEARYLTMFFEAYGFGSYIVIVTITIFNKFSVVTYVLFVSQG